MYDKNSCESNRIQNLSQAAYVVVKTMALELRAGVNIGFFSYYLCDLGYLMALISLLIYTMRNFFS